MSSKTYEVNIEPTRTKWLWKGTPVFTNENGNWAQGFVRFGRRRTEREARRLIRREQRRHGLSWTVTVEGKPAA